MLMNQRAIHPTINDIIQFTRKEASKDDKKMGISL